ncbi:MAG: histidine phosphatase family protein [Weeksellaceae bacterium]
MKKLILFRHGKSLWDTGVSDFDRDLSFIGIERTHKSAKELVDRIDFDIDVWYSSPALRAKRTADLASEHFTKKPKIILDEILYTFSFFDLLKFIKNLDNSINSAMFFGHNEAYTEFVNRMGDKYLKNLPTSGVAVLEFDVENWNEIEKGRLIELVKPKEL